MVKGIAHSSARYRATRVICTVTVVIGWWVVLNGLIGFGAALALVISHSDNLIPAAMLPAALAASSLLLALGFLLIMFSQLTRASLDSAENSFEILTIIRRRANTPPG
jgi:multisubunit Na+/H+ antiporter MnhE subunit